MNDSTITKVKEPEVVQYIAHQFERMFAPGQVIEIRVIDAVERGYSKTYSGYFDDLQLAAKAAASFSGRAPAVYVTMNPVNPDLLSRAYNRMKEMGKKDQTTSDPNIIRLNWLLVDTDPDRIAGISSTDEEHEQAIALAESIRAMLTDKGWPSPMAADSGNGAHLNYRVDLENTPENSALIQKCLRALDQWFTNSAVKVDKGNFNPARIWKVYGTVAKKGDHTEARPHRRAKVLDMPETLKVVSLEQLQALAAMYQEPDKDQGRKNGNGSDLSSEEWIVKWIADNALDVTGPNPWGTGRKWVFNVCPFNAEHTDRSAGIFQLSGGALSFTCHHNGCQGKGWADLKTLYTPAAAYQNGTGKASSVLSVDYDMGKIVDDDDYLLTQTADDEGNAQCTHRRFGGGFMHTAAYGWMHYTGTHWESGAAEYLVNGAIVDTLKARRVAAAQADIEAIVKVTRGLDRTVMAARRRLQDINFGLASDFDHDQHLLNTSTGVLNLRNGELKPHTPAQRLTYCIPTPYDPNADQTPWLDFLSSVIGEFDQIRDWLQMAVGYSITGSTREEIMFYLYGPARAGKGTFVNTIMATLGQSLSKGTSFDTFTKDRGGNDQGFDLAPMKAARFISAAESGKYSSMNEAIVKQITGGDQVAASFKHKDIFTYTPQYKIWVSSNHPVKGDVDDSAFWGRVNVIHFPYTHLGSEDKRLKQKLTTPAILSGVLAWAVEGARRWYADSQGLQTPHAVKQWTQGQRDDLDYVARWLGECCTIGTDDLFTTNATLYTSYKIWCIDNGAMPKHAVQWGRALTAKGLVSDTRRVGPKTHKGRLGVEVVE